MVSHFVAAESLANPYFSHFLPSHPALSRISQLSCLFTAGVAPPPVCKIEVKAVLEGFSSIKEQVPPREGTHPLHLHVSGSSGRGPASCLGPSKLTCREADRVCLPPSGSISGTAAGLTVEWIPLCSLSGPSLPCPAVRPATSWDAPLCPKLPGTHSASQGVS